MSYWRELSLPSRHELLVGFYDLSGYMRLSRGIDPLDLLETMAGYFDCTGRIIEAAGGILLKTLGDAGMVAFPAAQVEGGVRACLAVQAEGDAWLAAHGYRTRAVVKLHFGPAAVGLVGGPGDRRLDIYGATVNAAAVLPSSGFAMSPAVFRRLAPETRKLFRRHTPQITYIAADDPRPRGASDVLP